MKKFLWLLLASLLVVIACSKKDQSTREVSLAALYKALDQEIIKINQTTPIRKKHETIIKAQRDGNKLIVFSQVDIDVKDYHEKIKTIADSYTVTNLCINPATRGLLAKGAEIEYHYLLNDSEVTLKVNNASCQ